MKVRIRLSGGPPRRELGSGARRTAALCAALLTPVALMALALGGWRLAADMELTGEFAIREGIFSRWQAWVAIGVAVQFAAFLLGRIGGPEDDSARPAE